MPRQYDMEVGMSRNGQRVFAPIAAIFVAMPATGLAQGGGAGAGALDEIVVTARKREESLQDVPLVVNAITAEQIERSTLQGLADISLRTPGLNYEGYVSAGLSGGLVLRGLTNTQLTNRTQNVAVFYDGVYLPNQAMFDLGLADIERIEVLKGPQSALYGRNAFAGAVNYISRKPSTEWRADAAVTVGSDERRDYSAFVSGPLAGEGLLFKLAYGRTEFDGTIRNNHPNAGAGVSPGNRGNLGGYDNESYSAGLTLRPLETLEINIGYFKTDVLREPAGSWTLQGAASNLFGLTALNDLNCLPRTIAPGVTRNTAWCGELPYQRPQAVGDTRLPDVVIDPRQLGLNGGSSVKTATVTWDLNESLELAYQYGKAEYSGFGGGPNDRDPVRGSNVQFLVGSPVPVFRNVVDSRPNGDLEATSHELRLQSAAGSPLSWLAGAYHSSVDEYTTGISIYVPVLGTASIAPDIRNSSLSASRFEDRIRALYGSVEYALGDAWSIAAEARYNDEEKRILRLTTSTGAAVVNTPAAPQNTFQAKTFTGTTWRGTLSWQPQEDLLAYFSAAKGEKAGGFNTARNPDLQGAFNPETNTTLELGIKSEWLGSRLRFNGAVYVIDWKDIQGSAPQRGPGVVPTDANVIENRGGAKSKGIEFELGYVFTDNFSATLAASLNDPRYDAATFLAATVFCDGVLCNNGSIVNGVGNANIDGNSLERQSKRSASLLLTYGGEVRGLDLYSNLDFNYQSKQFLDALNLGNTGERVLANIKVGVANDNWDVSVWSRNLLDEKYVSSSFVIFFANSYVAALGDRRQYGLTVKYKL
jgi:iron complex outermembrane receptor protein